MKPILFPASATTFSTNGLGRLGATECFVERQVNGYDDLTMVVPVDDRRYGEISISKIVLAKPSNAKNNQAYRIYKISKPINGLVEVYAHHISYQLSYIPVMPYTATSCADALNKIVTNAAESCPFTFSTNKTITADWSSPDVPTSARAILQGQQGSILQRFKGEFEYDNWNVALKTRIGTDNGVVIRYGKNLTDLKQEESIENTYTGICPFYKSDDYVLTLPEKVLHSANASNFPYQRTLPVDLSSKFSEIPTVQQLRDAGNAYITENNIGIPKVSLEVSFIPLSDTEDYKGHSLESVELGDTVGVYFEKLGVEASAEVVYTKYNVLAERYDKIQIGSVKSSFSDTVAKQQEEIQIQKTNFEKAVQTATELINGGLGGYVRTTTNSAGQPQEILIMDTDDTATATNVIRMNQNGIGFSTTGYQGPFNSAWTIDGTFDASVINVINLIAHKVQAYNNDNTRLLEIMSGYMDLRSLDNGTWRQRVGVYLAAGDNGAIRVSTGLVDANGTPTGASKRAIILPSSLKLGVDENGDPDHELNSSGHTIYGSTYKTVLAPEYLAFRRDSNNTSTVYIDSSNANFNSVPINGKYASNSANGIQAVHGEASKLAGVGAMRSDTGVGVSMIVGTGGINHGIYSEKLDKWLIKADESRVYGYAPTALLTTTVDSGSITITNATGYNSYTIIGDVVSGESRMAITIPGAELTTTAVKYQIADDSNFLSFSLKKSGTSLVLKIESKSSTGRILKIYGNSL